MMPSDFSHQVTFSFSFQERRLDSPQSPRKGLGLNEDSLAERISSAVMTLNHSQGYSGASLPQFPPLVWPFPTSIPQANGLLVGNLSGYQVGGVGPYRIWAPEKSGLALTAAWRVMALALLRIATDELTTFESGLCNSRVVEVDIPIELAFNLAASHHQSRTAWRSGNPLEVNAFPKLVGERQKYKDPIDLNVFSAVKGPSQTVPNSKPSESNSFRFLVKPIGLAYAYALRLAILDRIAPSPGESKEALSLFFAWWRTLDSWESRFASHLLLSSGRPTSWGKSPTYDYLDSSLGQVLGKKGGPAHARRAMNAPRVVGARFLASVERMHDGLKNLRSHYQRAMSGLGLPTVSTPPMRPYSAPSLFIHPLTDGDVRIREEPGEHNQPAESVPRVQSQPTMEESVRLSGEPPCRPDGDPSRPSGGLEGPRGEEMAWNINEHKKVDHVNGLNTFEQASKQGTEGMGALTSACLPAEVTSEAPWYITIFIPLDEYLSIREGKPKTEIRKILINGMHYVIETIPNPDLLIDPINWRNGRYIPELLDPPFQDIPEDFPHAENGEDDYRIQRVSRDKYLSRRRAIGQDTSRQMSKPKADGPTVEEIRCIKAVFLKLGNDIWRIYDPISVAHEFHCRRRKPRSQQSVALLNYKQSINKIYYIVRDIEPLPSITGSQFSGWTVGGLEQLYYLLKGYSLYDR